MFYNSRMTNIHYRVKSNVYMKLVWSIIRLFKYVCMLIKFYLHKKFVKSIHAS